MGGLWGHYDERFPARASLSGDQLTRRLPVPLLDANDRVQRLRELSRLDERSLTSRV